MKSFFSSKIGRIVLIVLNMVVLFALFMVLNNKMHFLADDFDYMYAYDTGERVTSISQIPSSMVTHYFEKNGRIVDHVFATLLLMNSKSVINVIISLGMLLLFALLYFHIVGTMKDFSILKYDFIAALVFIFTPSFVEDYLWVDGTANYLFGPMVVLIALIPFRMLDEKGYVLKTNKTSATVAAQILAAVFMCALGFIAGGTNENTAASMVFMIPAFMLMYKLRGLKIRPWMLTTEIAAIAGLILMVKSPGSQRRVASTGGTTIAGMIKGIITTTFQYFYYFAPLVILFVVALAIYIIKDNERSFSFKYIGKIIKEYGTTSVYFFAMLAATYSMILAPAFEERSWGLGLLYIIMAVMICMETTVKKLDKADLKKAAAVLMTVTCISSLGVYCEGYRYIKDTDRQFTLREAYIQQCIDEGKKDISLPNIISVSPYGGAIVSGDLNPGTDWPNSTLAKHYGFDSVTRDDDMNLEELIK